MSGLSRRAAIGLLATGGGLLALGTLGWQLLQSLLHRAGGASSFPTAGGGMMGSATAADMRTYMEMFSRHTEFRRYVEEVPGGVRTTTESESADLVTQLQAHVLSMYGHLDQEAEVTCMSSSLPILFRRARGYRRELKLTTRGVVVTETSNDPELTRAIREHADEVSGFVREGMPAMMRGMMGG